MFRKSLSIFFNNHFRGDDRYASGDAVKPPVLRRRTLNLICISLLGIIVYGSIVPFRILEEWTWSWTLTLHKPSPADFIANMLLYIPVGMLLRLFFRRRGSHPILECASAIFTIAALSYATELVQQVLVARVPSLTDVLANTAGAALGVLLAPAAQRLIRNLHGWLYRALRERPFTAFAAIALLTIATYALMPFDPLPTRAHVEARFHAVLQAESLFPFGLGSGGDQIVSGDQAAGKLMAISAYGVLAFLLVLSERERGRNRLQAGWHAVSRAFAFVAAIELLQFFTVSHMFDPADLTGAWFCILLGTGSAYAWSTLRADVHVRPYLVVKGMATLAILASLSWMILTAMDVAHPGSAPIRVQLPMVSHFHVNWNTLLGLYTMGFLHYAFAALAVAAWSRSSERAPNEWMILTAALCMLLITAVADWWHNRPFDTCHLFLASCAAMIVIRIDRAFFHQPPRQVSTWVRAWCRSAPGTSPRERRELS